MKYKNEKTWIPKENFPTKRKEKREIKQFSDKIQKKGTGFIKWVFNNFLTDNQKESLYHSYKRDVYYYSLVDNGENNILMSKIVHSIIMAKILSDKEYKKLKRQWVISKIIE